MDKGNEDVMRWQLGGMTRPVVGMGDRCHAKPVTGSLCFLHASSALGLVLFESLLFPVQARTSKKG
jgi:hypothetical protein